MKATCVLNLLRRAMQGCSKQAKASAYIALVCLHLDNAHQSGHLIRKVPRFVKCMQKTQVYLCWVHNNTNFTTKLIQIPKTSSNTCSVV